MAFGETFGIRQVPSTTNLVGPRQLRSGTIQRSSVTGRLLMRSDTGFHYSDDGGITWTGVAWPFAAEHPDYTAYKGFVWIKSAGRFAVIAADATNLIRWRVATSETGEDGTWTVSNFASVGATNDYVTSGLTYANGTWVLFSAFGYVFYTVAAVPLAWNSAGSWMRDNSGFSSSYPLYDVAYGRGYWVLCGYRRIRYSSGIIYGTANNVYPDNDPYSYTAYYRCDISTTGDRWVLHTGTTVYECTGGYPAVWSSKTAYSAYMSNGCEPFSDGYYYFSRNYSGRLDISRTKDLILWQNRSLSIGVGPAYGVGVTDAGHFFAVGASGLLAYNVGTWGSGAWALDYGAIDTEGFINSIFDVNGYLVVTGENGLFASTQPLTIAGIVTDHAGAPCRRRIRFYRRDNGRFLGEQLSDPVTGAYEHFFGGYHEVIRIVLADDAEEGVVLNDIIDRILPG